MSDTEIHNGKIQHVSLFGLRLAIGAIFITVGIIKFDPGFADYLPQMGLPKDMLYLFALEEFVPGIFIIAGVLTRVSASILSAVMLGVIFYIDKVSKFIGPDGVELPVILLAVSLLLITTGPGKISLSHLLKKIPRFLQ